MNRQPMSFTIAALLAALATPATHAAVDSRCVRDCTGKGLPYQHCVADCSYGTYGTYGDQRRPSSPTFLPMPEPLPSTLPRSKLGPDAASAAPPAILDRRCLKDCRTEGFRNSVCKQRCTY